MLMLITTVTRDAELAKRFGERIGHRMTRFRGRIGETRQGAATPRRARRVKILQIQAYQARCKRSVYAMRNGVCHRAAAGEEVIATRATRPR